MYVWSLVTVGGDKIPNSSFDCTSSRYGDMTTSCVSLINKEGIYITTPTAVTL
jgi:hypothetical protein